MPNPQVFFDVTIGGSPAGRIVMELFADKCPKTAETSDASALAKKELAALELLSITRGHHSTE